MNTVEFNRLNEIIKRDDEKEFNEFLQVNSLYGIEIYPVLQNLVLYRSFSCLKSYLIKFDFIFKGVMPIKIVLVEPKDQQSYDHVKFLVTKQLLEEYEVEYEYRRE